MKDSFENHGSQRHKSSFKLINSNNEDKKNVRMSVLNEINMEKKNKEIDAYEIEK
jgi:hypothetical protein